MFRAAAAAPAGPRGPPAGKPASSWRTDGTEPRLVPNDDGFPRLPLLVRVSLRSLAARPPRAIPKDRRGGSRPAARAAPASSTRPSPKARERSARDAVDAPDPEPAQGRLDQSAEAAGEQACEACRIATKLRRTSRPASPARRSVRAAAVRPEDRTRGTHHAAPPAAGAVGRMRGEPARTRRPLPAAPGLTEVAEAPRRWPVPRARPKTSPRRPGDEPSSASAAVPYAAGGPGAEAPKPAVPRPPARRRVIAERSARAARSQPPPAQPKPVGQ